MSNRIFKSLFVFSLGLILLGAFAVNAQAQVPKNGKGSYFNPGHWKGAAYQTGENGHYQNGEWWSLVVSKKDDAFLNHANMTCLWSEFWTDNKKGVGTHIEACQIRDADKDVILTSANCAFRSWEDWCEGTIDGGTGKYKGISGTARYGFLGPFHEIQIPPEPHKNGDRWAMQGETNLRWEIEWKMP
jgi:hypothetical protein